MTARRERGRKKQKTEKERSIWGGKSCTRLGFPGGGAGDSPVAAERGGRACRSLRGPVTQRSFPGAILVRRCGGAASPFPGDLVPFPASAQKDDGVVVGKIKRLR